MALLVCLLATADARAADAATYALDPVHTRVLFAVDHAGFSKALGTVSGSTGILQFDPGDWSTATLQAEVPLTRIDLGDDKWNRAALARNLLNVEAHPVARFTSTRIEPRSAKRACVYGTLDLRGVSSEVVLDVQLNAIGRHPLPPFRRTIGFSATTVLSRADFGVTAWKSVIGDSVTLRIEAEATRTRNVSGIPDQNAADDQHSGDAHGKAAGTAASLLTERKDVPTRPEPANAIGNETERSDSDTASSNAADSLAAESMGTTGTTSCR